MEGCTILGWLKERGRQFFFFLLLNTQHFFSDPPTTSPDSPCEFLYLNFQTYFIYRFYTLNH